MTEVELHTSAIGSKAPLPRPVVFAAISDTHNKHDFVSIPPGVDVLLHAGDMTVGGKASEVAACARWLRKLPIPAKVVIPGNHDRSLEIGASGSSAAAVSELAGEPAQEDGVIFLHQRSAVVNGINIWGSGFQPAFWGAFQRERGAAIAAAWDAIPTDADIVITHGPAAGHGDAVWKGRREESVGCEDLLATVTTRVRPAVCVAGHIHEGYGCTLHPATLHIGGSAGPAPTKSAAAASAAAAAPSSSTGEPGEDGHIVFINAATCNLRYQPANRPVIFTVVRRPDGASEPVPIQPPCGLPAETKPLHVAYSPSRRLDVAVWSYGLTAAASAPPKPSEGLPTPAPSKPISDTSAAGGAGSDTSSAVRSSASSVDIGTRP